MDEPFTGLDPVNVMLLREAFLELRDRGRTVVFSTHQMEVAEALCESVAIVDRGRMVVGGSLRDVRRSTGRRMVRISVGDDHRLPWLASLPGARIIQAGVERSSVELDPGVEPEDVLAAAVAAGARVLHFEVADPTLEQVFIDHVGHPLDEDVHLAPVDAAAPDARPDPARRPRSPWAPRPAGARDATRRVPHDRARPGSRARRPHVGERRRGQRRRSSRSASTWSASVRGRSCSRRCSSRASRSSSPSSRSACGWWTGRRSPGSRSSRRTRRSAIVPSR